MKKNWKARISICTGIILFVQLFVWFGGYDYNSFERGPGTAMIFAATVLLGGWGLMCPLFDKDKGEV